MAKKHNDHPDEIDLTSFMYVQAGSMEMMKKPGCGGCHPGGGGMEYDRDGQRYDDRLRANPELRDSFDGDYYKSHWDRTGVVEADCFICHLKDYNFPERVIQLKKWNYKWASVEASGIGQVSGFVRDGDQPAVQYNRRLFNADGKIWVSFAEPRSENCVFCHGFSDRKKRGFSWNDPANHDIHNLQGMECVQCHPAGLEHQFAKGDENVSTVRDDLDNTMLTCEQCHQQGVMGAPRPAHLKIRPSHLEELGCEVCHIPAVHRAAGMGLDVTTGSVVNYATPGAKKIGAEFTWRPRYQRDEHGRLRPVNPLLAVIWTNRNSDGIYYPLFGREIKQAYGRIKDEIEHAAPNRPELHTPEQIGLMLRTLTETLAGNQRFGEIHPAYHKGGKIYELDGSGNVTSHDDHTWAGHPEGFNINHNVAPVAQALGNNGCSDCHANDAHMFKGAVVTDMFGPDGEIVTTRSGRLIGCRPWIYGLNLFHQRYVTPHLSLLIILVVFLTVLHYTGQGPKFLEFYYAGRDKAEADDPRGTIQRFRLSERWTHLFRTLSFILLTITGIMFFYNKIPWVRTFFGDTQTAVQWHIWGGIIFLLGSIVSFFLWFQDARFRGYDREWFKKRGGYLGQAEHPPAGRLNAGQKVFFWISTVLSVIVGVTGVILIFESSLSLAMDCLMITIHGFFALIFVAVILAHAYLGTAANPGTWRVLIDGKVSREWAQKHHSEWFKQVAGEGARGGD